MRPLPRKGTLTPQFGVRKRIFRNKKVKPLEIKEEKTVYETKEEKIIPEDKEEKNFFNISVATLRNQIAFLTDGDLNILLKDKRSTARKLAEEELKKREG